MQNKGQILHLVESGEMQTERLAFFRKNRKTGNSGRVHADR